MLIDCKNENGAMLSEEDWLKSRATMLVEISDIEEMVMKFVAMIDAMKQHDITEAQFYLDAEKGEWGIEAVKKAGK